MLGVAVPFPTRALGLLCSRDPRFFIHRLHSVSPWWRVSTLFPGNSREFTLIISWGNFGFTLGDCSSLLLELHLLLISENMYSILYTRQPTRLPETEGRPYNYAGLFDSPGLLPCGLA